MLKESPTRFIGIGVEEYKEGSTKVLLYMIARDGTVASISEVNFPYRLGTYREALSLDGFLFLITKDVYSGRFYLAKINLHP